MREGYGSYSLCVSVTMLAATYLHGLSDANKVPPESSLAKESELRESPFIIDSP